MCVDVKWKFTSILNKKGHDLEDSIQEPGGICILYESMRCNCWLCFYADWYITPIYALILLLSTSWNAAEPVELRASVSTACWRPTWRPISVFKTYLKTNLSIQNTETDILHCDTETDILLVIDIFCILKKLVYAHLKLAFYSPWQRL